MGQLAGWIKIQGDIPWFIVLSKKQKDTFKEPLIHISHLVKKKKTLLYSLGLHSVP